MADNTGVPSSAHVSVLIPTYRRPAKLAACLRGLLRQTLPRERFEVLVGLDGPDPESEAAAKAAWSGDGLRVVACDRTGYNAVRNRLLAEARGRTLVSLNDDVVPGPRLLEVHLAEQHAAERAGRPAVITGYSPWRRHEPETLADRLVRETSMVFFYDQMLDTDPERDWGFRHCWGLNFSAPMGAVREVGGFTAFPLAYGYDDIELAFRLRERYAMPVLFRPEARAEHDHRYLPADILAREENLGRAAWLFAGHHPAFALAVFGRDIRSEAELAYSREFVQRERSAAERLQKSFLGLADVPGSVADGPHSAAVINLLYEQHLLLKRYTWRRGLLAAAGG